MILVAIGLRLAIRQVNLTLENWIDIIALIADIEDGTILLLAAIIGYEVHGRSTIIFGIMIKTGIRFGEPSKHIVNNLLGILVYSTCTVNPAENMDNVHWLMEQYPEIGEVSQALGEVLTTDRMAELNYLVDEEDQNPRDVAHNFLVEYAPEVFS